MTFLDQYRLANEFELDFFFLDILELLIFLKLETWLKSLFNLDAVRNLSLCIVPNVFIGFIVVNSPSIFKLDSPLNLSSDIYWSSLVNSMKFKSKSGFDYLNESNLIISSSSVSTYSLF